MKRFTFDVNVSMRVRNIQIDAQSEAEAKEMLYSLPLSEIMEEDVKDFDITDVTFDVKDEITEEECIQFFNGQKHAGWALYDVLTDNDLLEEDSEKILNVDFLKKLIAQFESKMSRSDYDILTTALDNKD